MAGRLSCGSHAAKNLPRGVRWSVRLALVQEMPIRRRRLAMLGAEAASLAGGIHLTSTAALLRNIPLGETVSASVIRAE